MIVLSIIGGAAYAFNTAMLKGNFMVPAQDRAERTLLQPTQGPIEVNTETTSEVTASPTTLDLELAPRATNRKIASGGSAALTVAQYDEASTDLEIDWSSEESTYTLGKWSLATDDDIGVYIPDDSAQFYLGPTLAETLLSEYFTDIKTNIAFGDLESNSMYELEDTSWMYLISDYDYVLTVTGKPIASKETDFDNIKNEGPKVALTFDSIWTGSTDLANSPENTQSKELTYTSTPRAFTYDASGYSFGGYSLISTAVVESETPTTEEAVAEEAPAEETPVEQDTIQDANVTTGALEFAFNELLTGTGLTAKLDTTDLHFFSSSDSSTEVEATVELKTSTKGKSSMGATLAEGEYMLTLSPEGYVSQEFGPYTTAENVFLAELNIEEIEYGYYVYIDNDQNESIVMANTVVECDSLGDGYYGCAIPLSVSIPNFTVSNTEFNDYSASFTTVRDANDDPSETATMSLGDASPITGDDWVIPLTITDSIGQVIEGLTEENFDLGDQTLVAVEDLLDGNYYLFVGNPDSYYINISLEGYVTNEAAYDSEDFAIITESPSYNEVTLDYNHYIQVLDSDGAAISGATLTAGLKKATAITCVDFYSITGLDEDSGFYGCAIPSTHTSPVFTVTATGYDNYIGDFDTEGTLETEGYTTVVVTMTLEGEEDPAEESADDTDADGDTYTSANDCDDTDSTVYDESTYYLDSDVDGYGDSTTGVEICSATTPSGYVATGTDCSDTDSTVYENQTYYIDADSDGYGDASTYVSQCTMTTPSGYVTNSSDTSDVVATTTTSTTDASTSSSSSSSSTTVATTTSSSSSASATKSEILSDPEYVCQSPFYDIIGHWGQDQICRLYRAGIVSGKTSVTFAPNDYITRAEFLKIALGNAGYREVDANGLSETMLDVTDSDWYAPWIKIAESAGYLGNGNVNWYPNAQIYRKDAVVIAVRIARQTLYGFTQSDIVFNDVFVSDYFAYAVLIMNNTTVEGTPIINGYSNGQFGGGYHMTRAEVAAMISRAYLAWYN